jgi:hypothetical protein
MRAIGRFTTALLALAMTGAIVLGIRSVPDVKRYLAMRRM